MNVVLLTTLFQSSCICLYRFIDKMIVSNSIVKILKSFIQIQISVSNVNLA